MPPEGVLERLSPFIVAETRLAAGTFKLYTGTSADALRPRHFRLLSDGAILQLHAFMREAERTGLWAKDMQVAIMVLIGKPSGGWRLIGLLNAIYRLWTRIRTGVSSAWFGSLARPYFAMGRNKAAEDAAFEVSLAAEGGGREGGLAITTVGDLHKGYEMVDHEVALAAAVRYGYPLPLLRLALSMHRGRRRIAWKQTMSNAISTDRAIIAGCGLAMHILGLVCIAPADAFVAEAPRTLRVFRLCVDDFLLVFATAPEERTEEGRSETVEDAIAGTRSLVGHLQCMAKLPIAKSKGKTLASSALHGRKVGRALGKEGFTYHRMSQILGVDTGGGRRTTRTSMALRIRQVARKVARLKCLQKGGGRILHPCRALAAGAARYGTRAMGIPDHLLARVRRLVRTGTGTRASGSSLTLDLALLPSMRVDPAYMANAEPLVQWAKAVFMASPERRAALQEARRAAAVTLGQRERCSQR